MSNYAFAGYVDGNLDNTRNYNLAGSSEPPHTLPGPGDNVLLSDDGGIEFEPNFVNMAPCRSTRSIMRTASL